MLIVAPPPAEAQSQISIMQIQGPGHLSDYDGESVTTRGIVTAVAFNGFYIQDRVGDGNRNTSDGIFVFTGGGDAPAVRDLVDVTGTVGEFIPGGPDTGNLSVTQLSADSFEVRSVGNGLPRPVQIGVNSQFPSADTVISNSELPTNLQTDPSTFNRNGDAIDFYESLEGMFVKVDRPLAVSAVREFNPFSAEFFAIPSWGATVDPSERTERGGIALQPDVNNTGDQNPERIQIQFDGTIYPGEVPDVEVGDQFRDVRGVLGYSFGNYEVIATEELDQRFGGGLTPMTSRLVGNNSTRVSVASYNVLNLSPDSSDDAQRAKIADQLVNSMNSPHVVALQEIQDNSGELDDGVTAADETLQALVDAITAAGGPTYNYFDVAPEDGAFGGIPGGNIRNAFLYNPDRIELLDSALLDSEVLAEVGAPNPDAFDDSRSPLAGLFSFRGTPFTVVNVHDTSRFGSSPIFGAVQPFVQAGEQAREDQAAALNAYTDALLAETPDANLMVAGDFNTFEFTNDLTDILPGPEGVLTNLMTTDAVLVQDDTDRYTFIFDGNSQALDHFFVTSGIANDPGTRLDIVHLNVDFSRLASDVVASDHEPLLGRFELPEASGPAALPGDSAGDDTFTLQLLHASDLEGGVDALDRATNFAAIVDALEDSADADASVTISAGDNYIPGPFFGASGNGALRETFQAVAQELYDEPGLVDIREAGGRGDITIMNIIEFDASALGNHEFDAGTDAVETIIEEDVRGPSVGDIRWLGADFPYVSANLDFSLDPSLSGSFTSALLENTAFSATPAELAAGANPPKIAPSTYIDAGGEAIGVVGATTQLLAQISSPGDTTIIGPERDDMVALAGLLQPQIDALEAAGVNKIIVTSHLQQLALEEQLATLLDGVDIIIAGGSDSLLANDDDVLRAGDTADRPYPVAATNAAGDPVAIVSTDGEYSYVGRLVVDFDADGVLADLGDLDLTINGPVKTEEPEVTELWGSVAAATAAGTKANLVQQVVNGIRDVVIASDGNVLGETAVFLDGRRSQVRTEETNFGNLSADANLAAAQAFDDTVVVSLKNGGGIRSAIGVIGSDGTLLPPEANPATGKLAGQVSQLDIENSLRFNNGLTLLTLTAEELLAVLEHAVAGTEPGATPGQFGQVGGISYVYDGSALPGSRIFAASLIDADGVPTELVAFEGEVVDPTQTYRIVTLDFLAGGGDGYPFDALEAPDRVDLREVLTDPGTSSFADAGSEQDALAEFLMSNHGIGDGTPFADAETPIGDDLRIVELSNFLIS